MLYTLRFFFSLQNAVCFIMLTCLVPVLFIFDIQDVLKLKKNNSGAKGLNTSNFSFVGTAVAQWLRCCATNRKVAGSIPGGVIGISH